MALSFGVEDFIEGGVLAVVIILNVSIGFYQERKAEKKMDSLRNLSSPSARVIRDGKEDVIPRYVFVIFNQYLCTNVANSAEVVPGDICILKTGDTVPADMRMIEVMNLYCDEKSLTGESEPIEKITAVNDKEDHEDKVPIGDRTNVAHATTPVTKGRGRGIVIFTGMDTEVGKIAAGASGKRARKPGRSMSTKYGPMQPVKGGYKRVWDTIGKFLGITEGTPLQRKLAGLAYILFGCAIFLAIIVFSVNKFNVTGEVAIYAISTGIAIIPESLIA